MRIGDCIGDFIFSVLRVRRKVTFDNLRHAFPEKSMDELQGIARRAYRNFVKMTIEYMKFPDFKKEEIEYLATIENYDNLDWVKENGKGGMCIAGHFGSWELMGAAIQAAGYPMTFLVGEQHNKLIDNMMNRNRQLMGIEIVHMGYAIRGIIKSLRKNRLIALLSDQDAGKDGTFVQYFGRPASTPKGPALFALKTGSPVVFGSMVRKKNNRHRIFIDIVPIDGLKEATEENINKVTQAYTSVLEKYVRKYPDHWFWMHRRWKTTPEKVNNMKKVEA